MNKKIYYLHIPKTAGTTLNKFLQYGINTRKAVEHIESKQQILHKLENIFSEYDFISGHITFNNIEKVLRCKLNNYSSIVTFRNPLEHLLSHLTYVKEIGVETKRFYQHDQNIQKIVRKLNEIDFSNSLHLKELIIWLEKNNFYLFHNVQTVYLTHQPGDRFVGIDELKDAIQNLDKLNFIGLQERLSEFMLMLSYYLDISYENIIETKLNPTKQRYGLDINNLDTQEALKPLYELDLILYERAYEKSIVQFYDFIKKIEIEKNKPFLQKYKLINRT